MENASGAFLDAVGKSIRQIRGAVGATLVNPSLLTTAEKLQYEGYLRREETNATVFRSGRQRASSLAGLQYRLADQRNLVSPSPAYSGVNAGHS